MYTHTHTRKEDELGSIKAWFLLQPLLVRGCGRRRSAYFSPPPVCGAAKQVRVCNCQVVVMSRTAPPPSPKQTRLLLPFRPNFFGFSSFSAAISPPTRSFYEAPPKTHFRDLFGSRPKCPLIALGSRKEEGKGEKRTCSRSYFMTA